MKLIIADLKIILNNCSYDLIINSLNKYQSDFNGLADMTINCNIEENIKIPSINAIEGIDGWNWVIDEDGILMYNIHSAIKRPGVLIKINKGGSIVDIFVTDTYETSGMPLEMKFFLAFKAVMWYNVLNFNTIMLHSSALCYKGNTILFSAPSGTGKSTQSNLWLNEFKEDAVLINDDTPFIGNREGEFFVYGSPWSGKSNVFTTLKAPLKGIICLKQGKENKIRELSGFEAIHRIYNETRKPVGEEAINMHLDFITNMLEKTKVYELECTISSEAVHLVKNTLNL